MTRPLTAAELDHTLALLDDAVCVWTRGSLWDSTRCEEPPERVIVLGCVHEHLTPPGPTCKRCAEGVLGELAQGSMLCSLCERATGDEVPVVLVTDIMVEALRAEVDRLRTST